MSLDLRAMRAEEEPHVRVIFAACHPGWPARPPRWFTAYPTLVVVEEGALIGFTSFSVSNYTGLIMLSGHDLCVLPEAQGTGLGLALHLARCALGAGVGAHLFSGLTAPTNKPMIRIFERCGAHACQTIPRAYAEGDGVLYLGPIGGSA